jgi:hypothetical protein
MNLGVFPRQEKPVDSEKSGVQARLSVAVGALVILVSALGQLREPQILPEDNGIAREGIVGQLIRSS